MDTSGYGAEQRIVMHWKEFIVESEASSCQLVETVLEDSGALAITLLDAGDQPLLEPAPGETPLWAQVRIKALFDENTDSCQIDSRMQEQVPGHFGHWQVLKDQQWERLWLDRFKPRKFGQRVWIIPSGSTARPGDAINVFLDPGLAFGTGDHATTELCLRWLDGTDLRNKRVLDYGHGSGILSIAAKKLGARSVVGVDIDPQAIIAGTQNAKTNHLHTGIAFTHQVPAGRFDLLVANILAGPLIEMAKKLSTCLETGGNIALCGILAEQAEAVKLAYAPWITWHGEENLEGWVLISGTRNNHAARLCN